MVCYKMGSTFDCWLCHLLAMWPGVSYLTILGLRFLLDSMGELYRYTLGIYLYHGEMT